MSRTSLGKDGGERVDGEITWVTAQRMVFPVSGIATEAGALYVRGDGEIAGRRAYRVPEGGTASFATYFNALPLAIWQSVAGVDRLALHMTAEGIAVHRLFGVDAEGERVLLAEHRGSGDLVLMPAALREGVSWLWLETTATDQAVTVTDVEWRVAAAASEEVRISVCVTTMNRVEDCALLLRSLGDVELSDAIAGVFVVDQGSDPVAPHVPAGPLANGVPLRIIPQKNLGGSGGFSRGMLETLKTDATHVLLLDDDVRIEPESLRRLRALASVARGEPLLGAQMLSMMQPTVLHSAGEQIDRRAMWWHPVEPELSAADLATHSVASTEAMRRFRPVDFNGWWMCLIPASVVRRVGASMPYFIKWDDAEYGLRAAAAGHRTVTVPGVALWHVPWTSKDDGLDWQAYFQLRNRVVTALLHERTPRRVPLATWLQDLNHLFCLQYGSVRLRNLALRDILSGPSHLRDTLGSGRARAQAILEAAQQVVRTEAATTVVPSGSASRPVGSLQTAGRAFRVALHQIRPARTGQTSAPVARDHGKWWSLGLVDDAKLYSAAGSGFFPLRRSRRQFFSLLASSALLRIRLSVAWRKLGRVYRDQARDLTSIESWGRIYADARAGVD